MSETKLNKNYEVMFVDCNGYKQGDVVAGHMVAKDEGGIEYLLRVGAVKETSKSQKVRNASTQVQEQIDEAIALEKANWEATVNSQSDQLTSLQKTLDEALSESRDKDLTIADLTAKLAAEEAASARLTAENDSMKSDLEVAKATEEDLREQLKAAKSKKKDKED